MRTINITSIIIVFLLNCFSFSVNANEESSIQYFTNYLNNLRSFAADFTQVDSKGGRGQGTLLISKPYNFRCNYYPPFPLLIVGNQNNISMYDYEMETLSRMKTSENVFNFLLMNHVDLTNHFDLEVIDDTEDRLKVRLSDSERHSEVTIDKKQNQMKEVKIFESNNVITINFRNIRHINSFDNSLFMIQNPKDSGPERLSREELESQLN